MELDTVRRLEAEIDKTRAKLKSAEQCGFCARREKLAQKLYKLEIQKQAAEIALEDEIWERVPRINEARALIEYYVLGKKNWAIAEDMDISERHISRLKKAGEAKYEAAGASEVV